MSKFNRYGSTASSSSGHSSSDAKKGHSPIAPCLHGHYDSLEIGVALENQSNIGQAVSVRGRTSRCGLELVEGGEVEPADCLSYPDDGGVAQGDALMRRVVNGCGNGEYESRR